MEGTEEYIEEAQEQSTQEINTNVQSEKDRSYRNMKAGIAYSIVNLFIYAIVPFIVITLIKSNYNDLDPTRMNNMIIWAIIIGTIIAMISYFEVSYMPGHKNRMILGIVSTGMSYIWIFLVFGGMTIRSIYGEYDFYIDISHMIYLAIFGISLKLLYMIIEFVTCMNLGDIIYT